MRDLEGKFWALKRNEKRTRTVVEIVEEGEGDSERSKEPPSLLAGVTLDSVIGACCPGRLMTQPLVLRNILVLVIVGKVTCWQAT